jgi:hypothetical protein
MVTEQMHQEPGQPREETDEKKGMIDQLLSQQSILEAISQYIQAWTRRVDSSPRHAWRHACAMYVLVFVILLGIGALVWFGKIGSEVFTFALGLLVGLLSHHIRAVFPVKH